MNKPKPSTLTDQHADMAAEPAAVAYQAQTAQSLQALRHNVMDAVAATSDTTTLYMCLELLTKSGKHRHIRKYDKTDEELAAELSQYPDWDEVEHADLSQIDYSKYKPYQSEKTKKIIAKWL